MLAIQISILLQWKDHEYSDASDALRREDGVVRGGRDKRGPPGSG
jgi:hypothetical protein